MWYFRVIFGVRRTFGSCQSADLCRRLERFSHRYSSGGRKTAGLSTAQTIELSAPVDMTQL